jgi:hypothetical protein
MAQAVTKSDSTTYSPTKAIWVGTAGDLAVIMADDDSAVTFEDVAAGSLLPFSVTKVMSTNTTASGIVVTW